MEAFTFAVSTQVDFPIQIKMYVITRWLQLIRTLKQFNAIYASSWKYYSTILS